jgi:hypothetical protein
MAEVVETCRKMYLWPTNFCALLLVLFDNKISLLITSCHEMYNSPDCSFFFLSFLFSWFISCIQLLPLYFWHVRRIEKTAVLLSFVPVSPSVLMEQLGSHWTDLGIWCFEYFRKSVEEVQVQLKSDFIWRSVYISDHISLSSS